MPSNEEIQDCLGSNYNTTTISNILIITHVKTGHIVDIVMDDLERQMPIQNFHERILAPALMALRKFTANREKQAAPTPAIPVGK